MTDESTDSTPSDWARGPSIMILIHKIYQAKDTGISMGLAG